MRAGAMEAEETTPTGPPTKGGSKWSLLSSKLRDPSPASVGKWVRRKSMEAIIGGSSEDAQYWMRDASWEPPSSFHELSCRSAKGDAIVDMTRFAGQVCACVNVASL